MNAQDLRDIAAIAFAEEELKSFAPLKQSDVFDKIDQVPIATLVENHFGWEFDGKNFKKGDGKTVGCFVPEGKNFLVHGGTEHLPQEKKGYSPFLFVKTVNSLDNKQTFAWFADRYGIKAEKLSQQKTGEKHGKTFHPGKMKDEILASMRSGIGTPYTWGTQKLNDAFSPIERGNYIVLGGETGLGKTVFSLFLGLQNAAKGLKVLYLSFEMANKGLIRRYARDVAGISEREWESGKIPEEKILKAGEAVSSFPDGFFLHEFDTDTPITVEAVRKVHEKDGPFDMIIIDNLGFLDGEGEQENVRQSKVSRDIVKLSKELSNQACVIVLHHFRKGGDGKPRTINDLLGSGKIGHDVSYFVQVWRNQDEDIAYEEKAKLLVLLQKNREWGRFGRETVFYHAGGFHDHDQRLLPAAKRLFS